MNRSRRLSQARQYQETPQQHRRRLRRDRVLSTVGLVVFGIVLLLNLVMEVSPEPRLLPGGHSELYFLAAVVGLAVSTWIRFDLGATRRDRR